MTNQQCSIKESIQEILNTLNHPMYSSQNGQPPYSQLPEESVRLLNEQLKCLRESLAKNEDERKEKFEPIRFEHIWLEPNRLEPIWLKPIRFEPIRLEPKVFKPRKQNKSDGWRTPNQTPRGPVCRY